MKQTKQQLIKKLEELQDKKERLLSEKQRLEIKLNDTIRAKINLKQEMEMLKQNMSNETGQNIVLRQLFDRIQSCELKTILTENERMDKSYGQF